MGSPHVVEFLQVCTLAVWHSPGYSTSIGAAAPCSCHRPWPPSTMYLSLFRDSVCV